MQSVIERIASVPGSCVLKQELSSSPITKVYLCIFNNIKSVIRFDLAAASQLAVDRQNEINILHSINHLELAPRNSLFRYQSRHFDLEVHFRVRATLYSRKIKSKFFA